MKLLRTVKLRDEHRQPIKLWQNGTSIYWEFAMAGGNLKNGPFKTERDAIDDAEIFCEAGGA